MEVVFLFVLVGLMMVSLGVGFPVAFALPGSAILGIGLAAGAGWLFEGNASAYFHTGSAIDWLTAGVTNFRGIYWEADRDTLIAIPLFVFMGIMLQRSRIAEELLVTMARLFGALPGGLGISVVVVGALLAATTGIVGATVVAMGLISLPAMMRNNYSQPLATGTILASGTLGQIIPPSIVLIILADQLSTAVDQAGSLRRAQYAQATGESSMPSDFAIVSTSAGDMFMGALIPGLVLVGLYILFILGYALLRPKAAPSVRVEGRMDAAFWVQVVFATVPPLGLIVLVLGSIIGGVATVTQAGAIGAAGATVMAGYKLYEGRGRYVPAALALSAIAAIFLLQASFNLSVRAAASSGTYTGVLMGAAAVAVLVVALAWSAWRTFRIDDTLRGVLIDTAKTSALVFIILLGAAMLTSAFRAFGGEDLVKEFLTGLPGGFWAQFVVVMLVIFLLGFFLDFIEIAIVVVPIVAPILLANPEANVTAVWLGVMIGLNIQTSFLTPPFGFALFYLRGVASAAVRTVSMYKGVVPFIGLQLLSLVIVGLIPPLANYLPQRVALLSETAPPPRNPRLQHCLEGMVSRSLAGEEQAIRAALAAVRGAADGLPEAQLRELTSGLDRLEQGFARMADLDAAKARVAAAEPAYRPLHREVSAIIRDAASLDRRIAVLEGRARGYRGDGEDAVEGRARIAAAVAELQAEKAALLARIPARWDDEHKAFLALIREEEAARNAYRAAADQGYAAVRDFGATLAGTPALAALMPRLQGLVALIDELPAETAVERLRDLERALGEVPGAGDLRTALADVRRQMTGRNASIPNALARAAAASEAARSELAWRTEAALRLDGPLAALDAAVAGTLGLREQARLPRSQALELARCTSEHRDISLRF